MGFAFPDLPAGLDVSRETSSDLKSLLDLVEKWNSTINLVAPSTLTTGWERHIVDSAQLWRHAAISQGTWLDIGSGAGFPGLVIAILARELAPDLRLVLVESDQRKSVFLREAGRQLGLSTRVICDRAEKIPPIGARILSARALASMTQLLSFAERHLAPTGLAVFAKGRSGEAELEEARRHWAFQIESHPSSVEPEAVVYKVWEIRHV